MNEVDLKQILELAMHYPSGDNCQPFHFKYVDGNLKIYHIHVKAKHGMNLKNIASLISFGAFLACLEIAADQHNYRIQFWPSETIGQDDGEWGVVLFHKTEQRKYNGEWVKALLIRKTVRENFLNKEIPSEILKGMKKNEDGVQTAVQKKLTSPTIKFLLEMDRIFWRSVEITRDIFCTVIFHKAEYLKKRRGLYWKDLGVQFFEYPLLGLLKLFPWIPRVFWYFGFGMTIKGKFLELLNHSSGFVVFAVKDLNKESLIEVGRQSLNWWLRVTMQGMVAQPLSASTLSIVFNKVGEKPSVDLPTKNFFEDGCEILCRDFELEKEMIPVWLFRVGYPQNKFQPTLRQNVSEVLNQS